VAALAMASITSTPLGEIHVVTRAIFSSEVGLVAKTVCAKT